MGTFVSRRKVNLDRTASTWLIKRFVDQEAQFVFYTQAMKPEAVKEKHAADTIFDLSRVGAELFTEDEKGDRESVFQKIIRKYGIADPAVQQMATLLLGAHNTDSPSTVHRVLNVLIQGWKAVQSETDQNDDYDEVMERHLVIFDDLYNYLKHTPGASLA